MFDVYFFIFRFKTKLNLTPFVDYSPKLGGQKQSIDPVALGRSSTNTCISIDAIDSWIDTPSSRVLTLSGCHFLVSAVVLRAQTPIVEYGNKWGD